MDWLIALVALTVMEIVLGIDNVVFIAILAGKLPPEQQAKARTLGLGAALLTRIALLLTITVIMGLTRPLFDLQSLGIHPEWFGEGGSDVTQVSLRDLILLGGGLFLISHSVKEIHAKVEGEEQHDVRLAASFGGVIVQIALMDIIFSLDSVVTAVGMVSEDKVWVMVAAIVLAVVVMLVSAGPISRFVEGNPTVKILALSFLILIGVLLVAEGIGTEINKGYVYFAMAFSLAVEMVNMRLRTEPLPATAGPSSTIDETA